MAVLLSREVHDWETSACGALSFIPASALLLAEASHAPNGEFIVLDSDYYNPFVGRKDFHYLAQRGKLDLFFMSGIEIDREANFNLHLIGDPDSPEVRMPGQYGTGLLYYAVPRIVLFRTRHDRRTFVEKGGLCLGGVCFAGGLCPPDQGSGGNNSAGEDGAI